MVEDEKIKTQVSPFAMKEGEIKTFDGKDGYVSINQIIHRINLGHISEIHFKILELVNEFEFMTSRQIYQILVHRNVDIKSQDKLNNKLEQLIKTKILTRYYFSTEDGKCIYRVYCLEKMGKYLLNSRNIECKWQPTDNTKPVVMIKKRLAGNQVIIAYMRKVEAFDSYTVKPAITAKQAGKTFKANGGVKISKNNASIIVATYSSFGTGLDTENIKYVLSPNQCNKVMDNQAAGRARPLADGTNALYFIFIDNGFSYCKRKLRIRLNYLNETKSKTSTVYRLHYIEKESED